MKRVICYGCGSYGQYIMDQIVNCWTDEFDLLGTSDRACDEINRQIASHEYQFIFEWMELRFNKIYSITEVKELFDQHIIDGVVIALRHPSDTEEVSRTMEKLHITVFSLNDYWNYVPASYVAEKEYKICDRYKAWVVRDCRGVLIQI